jgi:hypothetical protein
MSVDFFFPVPLLLPEEGFLPEGFDLAGAVRVFRPIRPGKKSIPLFLNFSEAKDMLQYINMKL